MSEVAIECKQLTKVFKSGFFSQPVAALNDVSFIVPEGKVTGFLGPNGSGKSTFLKIATEFIKPTKGSVAFYGDKTFSSVKSIVSYVPEKPNFPSAFTGIEILKFHADLTQTDPNRIPHVLQQVGIEHAALRKVGGYSKGMKQRLAIAQALLSDPKLLILDEPLSGLDPDGREVLIQAVMEFSKKQDKTVILSSHLLEDLQRICNNLVIIKSGRVLFSGDPQEVFNPDRFILFYSEKGLRKEIRVGAQDLNETLKSLIEKDKISIEGLEPESKSISALYFDLTRKKDEEK